MVHSGPSSKRRRLDSGAAASAESIRQSNETLHLFAGARQNRWMQGLTSDASQGDVRSMGSRPRQMGAAEPSSWLSATPSSRTRQSAPSAMNGNDAAAVSGEVGDGLEGPESLLRMELSRPASNMPDAVNYTADTGSTPGLEMMVDYEAPSTSSTELPNQGSRKSLDAQARTATRQGLPSPAPSDENTNSPIVAEAPDRQRRLNMQHSRMAPRSDNLKLRPRDITTLTSTANTHESNTTTAGNTDHYTTQLARDGGRQSFQIGQAMPQPPCAPHQQLLSNGITAPRDSPLQRSQTQASSPVQWQHGSPLTGGSAFPVPRGNITPMPRSNSAAYQQNYQGLRDAQSQAPLGLSAFFSKAWLSHKVNEQLQLCQRQADPKRADLGRLSLLCDAVNKQDWFYIVLHQLSCLKTVSPSLLPHSAFGLTTSAYDQLDDLLCPNSHLQMPLVQWASRFPAPITEIYSDSMGSRHVAYEHHVQTVVRFLALLPQNWGALVQESVARQAPPLVQDMVERLALHSPVLQTTTFRAIARAFWTTLQDNETGIEYLLALHFQDQLTFNPYHIRLLAAKLQAYFAYKMVFESWKNYVASRSPESPPFRIPNQAFAAFGAVPPPFNSVQQAPRPIASAAQSAQPQAHTAHQTDRADSQSRRSTLRSSQRSPSFHTFDAAPTQSHTVGQFQRQSPVAVPQAASRGYHPQAPRRLQRRAIPDERDCPRPQPTHPDFTRSALHQAHIRSPIPGHATLQLGASKLFRQIQGCLLSPSKISKNSPVQTWAFVPEQDCIKRVPELEPQLEYRSQRMRKLNDGSITFRLRCCKFDPNVGFPDLHTWVTSDCVWPDTTYFDINEVPLEPRGKLHHGKYLPIDVTDFIKDGHNTVKAFVNRNDTDTSPYDFAIGIEIVATKSEEHVLKSLKTISATESLDSIKQSLSGGGGDLDDDIVMTSSTVTINLFDPISASQIFDVPVRGSTCKHRDPFDLATFLSTRARAKPGYASMTDDWRCPICRGDARPDNLIKDAFLMQVRRDLSLMGKLDTRAIVVQSSGKWEIKKAERTGVRSPSLDREEREGRSSAPASKKAAPVVIELD